MNDEHTREKNEGLQPPPIQTVYELRNPDAEVEDEKPAWKVRLEEILARYVDKPQTTKTWERLLQAIAGPIRDGIASGGIDPRLLVWDLVQTESDVEARNMRILPRHHTAALIDSGATQVKVHGSLILEHAEAGEFPELAL